MRISAVISGLILCLLLMSTLIGQQSPGVENPVIRKMYQKARSLQRKGEVDKSLKQYQRITKKEPGHVASWLGMTGIYYSQGRYSEAEESLREAIHLDPGFDPEMYYSMALIKDKLDNKEGAMDFYRQFISLPDADPDKQEKAKRELARLSFVIQAKANPVPFDPVDPGPGINTELPEYLATVDVTGEKMVFSRRIRGQEDLFYSLKTGGVWNEAQPLSRINTQGNEAAHYLSQDAQTLLFTSCDRRDSYGGCDLYISRIREGYWSAPVNMGPPVNTRFWESQPVLSADGRTLFFSSKRPGGQGGKDIWYCRLTEDGDWTEAVNAGERINTDQNEEAPFLHPDGKTLYFMSDGHPGMGGYDLFLVRLDSTGWSVPLNLGYPINTEFDEGALRVEADGSTAWFSTDRTDINLGRNSGLDIYSFQLPPESRAGKTGYVRGRITDLLSGLPLQAGYRLVDNATSHVQMEGITDASGIFLLTLPPGFNYNFTVQAPGYVFHSENFRLDEPEGGQWYHELFVEMVPVPEKPEADSLQKKEFVLKNLFFESGSSRIDLAGSAVELENLTALLRDYPDIGILIQGHTDSIGEEQDNQKLSEDRARAVYDYLIGAGISAGRMNYTGFGELRPVAPNETEDGRRMNRRTTFVLTKL